MSPFSGLNHIRVDFLELDADKDESQGLPYSSKRELVRLEGAADASH